MLAPEALTVGNPDLGSVFSDGSADFVDPPPPHTVGQPVTLRIRALAELPVEKVQLRIVPDGEERLLAMAQTPSPPFNVWSATTRLTPGVFRYRFRILLGGQIWWRNAAGIWPVVPPDEHDFRLAPGYVAPPWIDTAVVYQIFPDRFCCSRPATALAPRPLSPASRPAVIRAWHERPARPSMGNEFFGGDLWGVIDRLDHLELLGVNTIYVNPIFEAASNHRYDAIDLERVDPTLGGDEALAALGRETAARGMRLVLDGVFNHIGRHSHWFRAAVADRASPYRRFFTFTRYPDRFVSWLGHTTLPKLDYASPRLRRTIFSGPDAIARRWLREPYRVAGWRLDAANMLGCHGSDQRNLELWRAFRRAVRAERDDAWLLGESFTLGRHWLQGDAFDAIMNYQGFTLPIIQWLAGTDLHGQPAPIDGTWAAWALHQGLIGVPFEIRNQLYNALSSHDIIRFIRRVEGHTGLYLLAAAIQMAWPGVPGVYYGEEIALDGGPDPDNRRPMPWDEVERHHDLIAALTRMIGIRRRSAALQRGAFAWLAADPEVLAFTRFVGNEFVIVAANRSGRLQRVQLPVAVLGLPEGLPVRDLLAPGALHRVGGRRLPLSLRARQAVWLVAA